MLFVSCGMYWLVKKSVFDGCDLDTFAVFRFKKIKNVKWHIL